MPAVFDGSFDRPESLQMALAAETNCMWSEKKEIAAKT